MTPPAILTHGLTAFIPVLLLLAGLVVVDSYKLVRLRTVLLTVALGCVSAALAYPANTQAAQWLATSSSTLSRYVAPIVEEILKGAWVVVLIRRHRIGFLVDAAILGFALGTGFALVENVYYFVSRPEMGLATWIVRGFGTAIMHGGTTSVFAMISKVLYDRATTAKWLRFGPGLGVAIFVHSAFNHFVLPPLISAAVLLAVFPMLIAVVFQRSETLTREWLGTGFDSDQELLDLIMSGRVTETPVGRYLQLVRASFPPEVIFDMLAMLQLHVELAIRAKGILMMKQAGFQVEPDPTTTAQLDELLYLQKSIGKTGMLAIHPFLHTSNRDLWEINMLRQGS